MDKSILEKQKTKKDHLDKARIKKDDEFYTLYTDVEKIFDIIPNKEDYHFILPFKDVYSSFKKYCEINKLEHTAGHKDYKEFNYNIPNALVVSNPPFSKFREIINFYMFYDIKFILVAPQNGLAYSNVFNYWKEWKLNPLFLNIRCFKRPDGSKQNVQCFLLTNLPSFYFCSKITKNINQELFWEPKRLAKTEYHIYKDNEIIIDKMGQNFKKFIYDPKFYQYKKIYFPITAILTLTLNANRENFFLCHGLPLENGKRTFKKLEFRREDEE